MTLLRSVLVRWSEGSLLKMSKQCIDCNEYVHTMYTRCGVCSDIHELEDQLTHATKLATIERLEVKLDKAREIKRIRESF